MMHDSRKEAAYTTRGKAPPEANFVFFRGIDLLPLLADPLDTLDQECRPATFLGDLAVLLHDEAAQPLVAVETAQDLIGHAAVRPHRRR